ncbi:glycoside hydrolase family 26 protein [Planomonospora corallina]|uniref:Glycoside hydrolase family 26 protein n=1 Tax=Planomonospora corallina TaxID=1806052 RepID=A0ABV8IBV1_9ACTN
MTMPGKGRHARHGTGAAPSRWIPVTLVAALVTALAITAVVYMYAAPVEHGAAPPSPTVPGDQATPRSCVPTSDLVPPCGAWWGMHVPPDAERGLVDDVTAMEEQIGRRLDIVISYHDMSEGDAGRFFRDDESKIATDRIMFLGWESSIWEGNVDIPWHAIARGELDRVIDAQAERVKEYGRPVLIGFDGEKDREESGQTAEEYIAAYKRIVDRFRLAGADNALWVWGVTGYYPFRDRWKPYYPGDDYVDWISFDPYNFATCRGAKWQDFEETVRPTYEWFQENGFSHKPLMLAEYGTESHASDPSAKGEWFRDIPAVMREMPNLKAIIQWNNTDADECDFTLTGPGVLQAFSDVGKDPYFRQPLP